MEEEEEEQVSLHRQEREQGPTLAVDGSQAGAYRVLSVRGELDLATAPILAAAVVLALQERPARLALDLSGTTFVDSSGSRELVRAVREGRRQGTEVVLVVPERNSGVRRVLDLVGFGELAAIHPEVPAGGA